MAHGRSSSHGRRHGGHRGHGGHGPAAALTKLISGAGFCALLFMAFLIH